MNNFCKTYLEETIKILHNVDQNVLERMANSLAEVRSNNGRLFILGVGGSAGYANHAVNDFRKICEVESYAPTDNVSELTARTNDEGWDTVFSEYLRGSKFAAKDAVLVFSVGGGNLEKNLSVNLIKALEYAKKRKGRIFGIVGRDGGFTGKVADECIIIDPINPKYITTHTEGICAVLWHLLISHPSLQVEKTKWESLK